MNTSNIGLSSDDAQAVINILETTLATEVVINMKIRNYHWNVTAPNFSDLHKFFEEMYEESSETIDDIAERIRALGEMVDAHYKNFLSKSIVMEETHNTLSANAMIENLLHDKETIIIAMRKDIKYLAEHSQDIGTEDFLTGLIQAHEKNAWMLRSMV